MGMLEMVFLAASRPWMFVGICIGLLAWGMFPVVLCEGLVLRGCAGRKNSAQTVFSGCSCCFSCVLAERFCSPWRN